ncbi:uncharacterized protein DS421_5g147330 [Arachis hypogaea]|nr:uncharacterized protein DS421_5g147330 [Arachis hypogaea]
MNLSLLKTFVKAILSRPTFLSCAWNDSLTSFVQRLNTCFGSRFVSRRMVLSSLTFASLMTLSSSQKSPWSKQKSLAKSWMLSARVLENKLIMKDSNFLLFQCEK